MTLAVPSLSNPLSRITSRLLFLPDPILNSETVERRQPPSHPPVAGHLASSV